MTTIKTLTVALCLICSLPLLAARVVETEDIDSFIDDDPRSQKKEYIAHTVPARQDRRIPHKIFSLGLGFNFGIFVGDDIDQVNDHMYARVSQDSWSVVTRSETKLFLNLVPRFTVNIMPVRYVLIQVLGEVGWGPKMIMDLIDQTYTFHFMRYSPGLMLNGYIPLGSTGKYSLFLGGGAFYHFFTFERYEAQGFGGRGQMGLRFDWKSFALEVFAAYDYARGETDRYNSRIGKNMVLDYSSVLFGVNLYFKII